jgi:hypothetical protein
MDEVEDVLGPPKAQAEQGPYNAWRYEYRLAGSECSPPNLRSAGAGSGPDCGKCEHATVWFNNGEVRSVTSIRIDTQVDCRTQSTPIIWEYMPAYAKEPKG